MNFREKLLNIVHKNNSLLCVGLDIDKEKLPKFLFETKKDPYLYFNKSIINHTKDLVCAYKLNMAFYEVLGKEGIGLLQKTIEYIPKDVFIILGWKSSSNPKTEREEIMEIIQKIDAILEAHGKFMSIRGANVFWAYQRLQAAKGYLESELRLLERA